MRADRQTNDWHTRARNALLTAIGQGLRVEYGSVGEPMPEHLATLLKQLDEPSRQTAPAGQAPARPPNSNAYFDSEWTACSRSREGSRSPR